MIRSNKCSDSDAFNSVRMSNRLSPLNRPILMEHPMRSLICLLAAAACLACVHSQPVSAQQPQPAPPPGPAPQQPSQPQYSSNEILDSGHRFFGTVSRGLAQVVEKAFSQFGQPNGYILGEEAGGAFVAGLRYGEGTLY